MTSTDKHQDQNPGTPGTEGNPGVRAEGVTREELAAEMDHFQEVMELRREQDRALIALFDKSLAELGERFDKRMGELGDRFEKVETVVMGISQTCSLREGELDGYQRRLNEVTVRVETNETKIGELREGYAGLKAWIVIVGGITGVASAIAIIFG